MLFGFLGKKQIYKTGIFFYIYTLKPLYIDKHKKYEAEVKKSKTINQSIKDFAVLSKSFLKQYNLNQYVKHNRET